MRRPSSIDREPAPRWLLVAMLGLSLLLHAGAAFLPGVLLQTPPLELEFELPMDVELGTAEELNAAPAPSPAAPPPAPTLAATDPAPGDGGAPRADAGLVDAGPGDAALPDEAGRPEPRARDAGASPSADDAGAGPGRLPPGAQIALRVDMARIRTSPIAQDVRALIAAIPDWQALLEGSGIDPVEQLDRLLIATPNLQREKLVLAGRYVGGEEVVTRAVEQLGQARGQPTSWRSERGIRVAPWANADATPRVIALVGPAHFTISRAEDLPRVLAIAAARAQRKGKARTPPPAVHPADALLSMEPDEGVSLEIEGAAQFVRRGRRGVPERLRLSALERPGARIELRAWLTYADVAQAEAALAYWQGLKDAYASNALVLLLGLGRPLDDAKLTLAERELSLRAELGAEQARLILGYVRELVRPPAPPPGP